MTQWDALKSVLKRSVERNGEQPLSNQWLLNICEMADRYVEHHDSATEASLREFMDKEHQWGGL